MKDIDFRTDRAAEGEWQAQQRGDGPYAAVARAARQGMEPALPADFAERVAATAQARARALRQPARLETWLIAGLLVTMLGGGVAAMAADPRVLEALSPRGALAQPWLLGLAACAAVTQGMAWLLRPARLPRG